MLGWVIAATLTSSEVYSAAVCVNVASAAHARAHKVVNTVGRTAVVTSFSRAETAAYFTKQANELRKKAAAEKVALLACGDPKVRALLKCVRGEDCDASSDDVDKIRDLLEGAED